MKPIVFEGLSHCSSLALWRPAHGAFVPARSNQQIHYESRGLIIEDGEGRPRMKFGKAREAVAPFKEGIAIQKKVGAGMDFSTRLRTDGTGPFYTVVLEITVPSLAAFEEGTPRLMGDKDWQANYQKIGPLVESGYREMRSLRLLFECDFGAEGPMNPNVRVTDRLIVALGAVALAMAPALAQQPPPLPAVQLAKVSLPPGFQIALYAEGVPAARQMALAPDGTVFVGSFGLFSGNPKIGNVYAVRDTNRDGRADEVKTILMGLNMPNGVAFRDGALFVGEQHRLVRYNNILTRLDNPPAPIVLADLPTDPNTTNHSWKYLAFGPDGKLYVPVGGPCNVCDRGDPWATILRMNPDGSGREIYARGVRNSVGLAFDPVGGALWFTDNGRDMLGDNLPSDEVNRATAVGQHFGFPYCHQGDVLDPEFGKGKSCTAYVPPIAKMGPHVAAIGLTFYTGAMFPAQYKNQLFVAEHGSWNRSAPLGYRLAVVRIQDGTSSGQEVFAGGFFDGKEVMGRPVDVLELADGSLLVSDDLQGKIYRITYRE